MPDPVLCVVVAHASASRIADTLRSIEAQTYRDIEVVVAALPGADVPAGAWSVVPIEPSPHGVGFPDAVRAALASVDTRAPYLLLAHDDVELDPGAVGAMVQLAATDPAIGAVGAKLVEWSRADLLQEVGGGIDRYAVRRSALEPGEIDSGQRDETSDVLYCSDACLLVRADALADVGGLDPGAWPFYADVDLCWRLRASGRRVVVATGARVRHAAALARGERAAGIDHDEALERGRLRFMLKHFSAVGLAVLVPQLAASALGRIVVAAARREFWTVRAIVRAWTSVVRELRRIRAMRAGMHTAVSDRELLALSARVALLERRGLRSEWMERASAAAGALGRRVLERAREPVAWATVAAALVVVIMLRGVLFGGTFVLGELRELPTFADALRELFERTRSGGLDPFAPATPALVVLGAVRSLLLRGGLAEKAVLVLPLFAAASAGARIGSVLRLGPQPRRFVAVGAAVNPVTLALVRNGSLGALVVWVASLFLFLTMLSPRGIGESWQERLRFGARWAAGFAVVGALHPPGLVWLAAAGGALTLALRGDGNTVRRLLALATGATGAVVLLAPWSFEWFTTRTPIVGRHGWLVDGGFSSLGGATLGAGWPLLLWLFVAFAGATFVGHRKSTIAASALGAAAVAAGTGGVMPADTMLVGVGSVALLLVATSSRRISEELRAYELGLRHALVVSGAAALAVSFVSAALVSAASGARESDVPVLSPPTGRTGRVLWLATTSGGVRTWATTTFSTELDAFPAPGGPAAELVAESIEAARTGRTHRLGGLVALADVSHVIALDTAARRGLDEQADLGPLEIHDEAVVYKNESWRGPAMLLASAPSDPLSPQGLAALVRTPRAVEVAGWPDGSITIDVPADATGVLHVAAGPRRNIEMQAARRETPRLRIDPAGVHADAGPLRGTTELRTPGWTRALVPLELILASALLMAWLAAAYLSPELPRRQPASFAGDAVPLGRAAVSAPLVVLAAAVALGWTGRAVAAGGPFLSSAWYCPPVGRDFRQTIGIANANERDVSYQVRSELGRAPEAEGLVAALSRETVEVRSDRGAVVESYGRRLVVATQVERSGNRDSSLCASVAREANLFPEGGRAATRARPRLFERYVIFNPFGEVARASVRFVSPDETIAPPALQDVQVQPGTFAVVNPEEQFEPMLDLSTVVRVWQGRAVVARRLETVEQISWAIGSELVGSGVLPRAITQDAVTALIALNPSDESAQVTITGAAARGSIAPQRFDVPPSGRTSFEINPFAPNEPGLVVSVEATRPVAIESLVIPGGREALSLLPPLRPERRWVVPMAEQRALVLTNPRPRPTRVTLRRLGQGPALEAVTIEPNRMLVVPLEGPRPFGVLVRSEGGPVTAVAVGDAGSVRGVPLQP